MKLVFADGVPERFVELPRRAQLVAQQKLDLILTQPRMYPVRSRGVLRGQRYFYLEPYLI